MMKYQTYSTFLNPSSRGYGKTKGPKICQIRYNITKHYGNIKHIFFYSIEANDNKIHPQCQIYTNGGCLQFKWFDLMRELHKLNEASNRYNSKIDLSLLLIGLSID